ncbi:MAG TPA: HAMP domain-containing sensor histidine kinase [Candidatus Aquicultor sp.]|jgi:signal transduction histidine kinase
MRSIFAKILVSGLFIALVTALALSFILSSLFGRYYENRADQELNEGLHAAETLTKNYLAGRIPLNAYAHALQMVEDLEGSHFIIIDSHGKTVINTRPQIGGGLSESMLRLLAPQLSDDQILEKQVKDSDSQTLKIDTMTSSVSGAKIIAYNHLIDIREPVEEISRLVWIATVLAFFISIIPAFIMSKHFTAALVNMNEAAKTISQGDFSVRVTSNRNDEIGELASTLDYMATQLDKIEQTRQDFLANVSHELRTPLTSIRGFVQGMLDGTIHPEQQTAYLARVYSEAGRLSKIVDDLLTLARLQSGRVQFEWKEEDPAAVLSEVVEILEPQATEKQLKLELVRVGENRKLRTDRNRLAQIYMNVLANAIKFSPSGGTITVNSVWNTDGYYVTVLDEGSGIPEDELPSIFERFYTGSGKTDRELPGSGLGLAISKLLVEEHAGTITAVNRAEKGSEFTIFFPSV